MTGYRVTTVPASAGCKVKVTTCVITGLVNGEEYAVTVVAANAAGTSAPSAAVTVRPPGPSSILITGTRTERDSRIVSIRGETRNLDAVQVQPYFSLGNQREFQPSQGPVPVVDDAFTWQRNASRRITVYVKAAGVESNRVTVRAR